MLQFVGFELDLDRAELRSPGGEAIRLRPKAFALLHLFATNPRRVLSKQELMAAIWPNVHVGEDSLFQCIREIRTALGDGKRGLVKSVSGRGYLFEADVSSAPPLRAEGATPPIHDAELGPPLSPERPPGAGQRWLSGLHPRILVASAAVCIVIGVAVAAPMLVRRLYVQEVPTIAVVAVVAATADQATAAMAANVTYRLTDGLSKIGNIRVLAPRSVSAFGAQALAPAARPALVLNGDLQRGPTKWGIQARLIDANTGQVQWSSSYAVPTDLDEALQQSRLAAGIGHPLALRLNSLTHARLPTPDSKIVVEQSAAFINRTSRERFATAQAMLEKALSAKPDDVDLEAALAAHLLRGIQTAWYTGGAAERVERRAKDLLDRALKKEPTYIPVLEGYCRFLTATNRFADSLIACEKVLTFQPWDGLVLYHIGLSQLQSGRFEDALATFQDADALDTPQVSRWTWLLGAGLALVFLERNEEALPWLERSIAITPGTGRTHLLIAAAHQELGRFGEAKVALAKALHLRPGSNTDNIALPTKNQSPRFLQRSRRIKDLLIAAGLPER